MNKTLLIIVAIVLIGGLGIYLFATQADDIVMDDEQITDETNTDTTDADNDTQTPQIENTLVLAENETGSSVGVASVSLSEAGFIAFYRMNSQSDVDFIGTSDLLAPGVYTDLEVSVNSGVVKDQVVVGVLYADDGNGEFDAPESDYYLTNNYEVVTDTDVIDTDFADESEEILQQAQEYLDAQATENEEVM